MRVFYYEWDDGTLSVGVAKNKTDAIFQLDEIGDAERKNVHFVNLPSFFFTFGKKRCTNDSSYETAVLKRDHGCCPHELAEGVETLLDEWANPFLARIILPKNKIEIRKEKKNGSR